MNSATTANIFVYSQNKRMTYKLANLSVVTSCMREESLVIGVPPHCQQIHTFNADQC